MTQPVGSTWQSPPDGGHVSDVLYKNITMDNLTSPLQFYIGARRLCRCPGGAPYPGQRSFVGRITDIVVDGVTATNILGSGHAPDMRNWSVTLDGQPPDSAGHVRGA